MISQLLPVEIETVLQKQVVGRIACQDDHDIYIVPISYAYDGDYIYCHSYEGKKVRMMRSNPKVCFQVDIMKDMSNWQSVVAWGKFEELTSEADKKKALEILLRRRLPALSSVTTHLGDDWPFTPGDTGLNQVPGLFFRIELAEKTGMFEETSESAILMCD